MFEYQSIKLNFKLVVFIDVEFLAVKLFEKMVTDIFSELRKVFLKRVQFFFFLKKSRKTVWNGVV